MSTCTLIVFLVATLPAAARTSRQERNGNGIDEKLSFIHMAVRAVFCKNLMEYKTEFLGSWRQRQDKYRQVLLVHIL